MSIDAPGRDAATDVLDIGELQVSVTQRPTAVLITAVGELDLGSVHILRTALAGRTLTRQDIVVDLSGLTFIDSTGVKLLLSLRSHASRTGTDLRLVVNDRVERVLQLAGLAELFDLTSPPHVVRGA